MQALGNLTRGDVILKLLNSFIFIYSFTYLSIQYATRISVFKLYLGRSSQQSFFLPSTFTWCISVNVWQFHTVNLFVRNFFLVSKMCSSRADCCVCSAGCLHFSLWCFQWIQWINLLKTFCKYLFLNEGNNVMFFLLIVINQLIKSHSTKM